MDADFLIHLGGGFIAAVADAAVEIGMPGIIPETPSPLPPGDDFVNLGITAIPLIVGIAAKNDLAKTIGEGMLMYSGPNALKDGIVRACIPAPEAPAARKSLTLIRTTGMYVPTRPGLTELVRYGPEQRIITAPKFIPGVLRPRYGLGA